MIRLLLPAFTIFAAFWAARIVNPSELDDRFERIEAWLRRPGPIVIGVVSILIVWWVWGDLRPLPVVHDESSYALQAEIFARFRWTAPSPPIPEFFEQPHVLRFQPGFFSETTSTALVLAAWWCLLEWRETRKKSWVAFMALAVGWGAITRPVTMLAFAIPIAVVVVNDVVRYRLWLDAPI